MRPAPPLTRRSTTARCCSTCCLIGAGPESIGTTEMRGGRDERDDKCSLGFDPRKDNLVGVMPTRAGVGHRLGRLGTLSLACRRVERVRREGGDEGTGMRGRTYARLPYASTAISRRA